MYEPLLEMNRSSFKSWVDQILAATFVTTLDTGVDRNSFGCQRTLLTCQVLETLEASKAKIARLFRAIRTHIGLVVSVVDEASTCMVSGTRATHHRRVRTHERVGLQVTCPVEMVLRHDMIPFVRAYYIYVHFERFVMAHGNASFPRDEGWYDEMYRKHQHCERHCRLLLSPLLHDFCDVDPGTKRARAS